jgi:Flp pilus assembly protein TadG
MTSIMLRVRRFLKNDRGAVMVLGALALTALVGIGGLAVDVANIYAARTHLQATTDLAALAGAQDINCCSSAPGTARQTAIAYSAASGQYNARPGMAVTVASGYPQLKCLSTFTISCGGVDAANAIVVQQQTTVPLYLGRIFGPRNVTITATATAVGKGGVLPPLHVMFVLDTTGSMNSSDPNCTIKNASKLDCAKAGLQQMLLQLNPSVDWVGLMVYPPVATPADAAKAFDCKSSTTPSVAAYKNWVSTNENKSGVTTPQYTILGLGQDYRASDSATTLATTSNINKAVGAGGSNCSSSLQAIGGVGTYFADAITAAQANLVAGNTTGYQNVIVLLSDGDAGASSGNMASAKYANQCKQAVTAAQNVAKAGTWIYSIAYGAAISGGCNTDSPAITPCSTMQQIASDPTKFYSDGTGKAKSCQSTANTQNDLLGIFKNIANDLRTTQLVPNNTP